MERIDLAPARSAAKPIKKTLALDPLYPVCAVLVLVGLWQLAVQLWRIPDYLLPSPLDVAYALIENGSLLWKHFFPTLRETLEGYLLAVVVGIPVAVLITMSKYAEKTIYPIVVATQAIPKIAVAPLFVVWFGFGEWPKALTAFLICFFPIVVDGVAGLRSTETELVYLLRSMGAGNGQIFLKARIPRALPHLFAGLKVSMSLAVVGAIVAEFVGADRGLGHLLLLANGQMQTPLIFATLVVLSMMGIVLYYLVEFIEKKAIPWHVSQRGE